MPRLALPAFSVIKDQRCHDVKQFDEKYPSLDIENNSTKTRQRLFSYPMCNSVLYRTKHSPLPKVQEESASCPDELPRDSGAFSCDDESDGDCDHSDCEICASRKAGNGTAFRQRSISLPTKKEHLEQLRHLNHVVSHSTSRFAHYKLDRDIKHSKRLCRSSSLNRERKRSDLPNIQESGDFSDDQVLNKIVADEVEKLHNFRLTSCPRRLSCPQSSTDTSDASDTESDASKLSERGRRLTARERRIGYCNSRAYSAPAARP